MCHNLSITFIKYHLVLASISACTPVTMRILRTIGRCSGGGSVLHGVKKRLQYLSFGVTIYQKGPVRYAGSSVKGGLVGDLRQAGAVE